jgi:hypothetical protein
VPVSQEGLDRTARARATSLAILRRNMRSDASRCVGATHRAHGSRSTHRRRCRAAGCRCKRASCTTGIKGGRTCKLAAFPHLAPAAREAAKTPQARATADYVESYEQARNEHPGPLPAPLRRPRRPRVAPCFCRSFDRVLQNQSFNWALHRAGITDFLFQLQYFSFNGSPRGVGLEER